MSYSAAAGKKGMHRQAISWGLQRSLGARAHPTGYASLKTPRGVHHLGATCDGGI